MTEQRPRMQSRAEVVPLRRDDAVVFAVYDRPVDGAKGAYRVNLRHGVSRVRAGRRHTLGLIFYDATCRSGGGLGAAAPGGQLAPMLRRKAGRSRRRAT